MKRLLLLAVISGLTACASNTDVKPKAAVVQNTLIKMPSNVTQGNLVIAHVPVGSTVEILGETQTGTSNSSTTINLKVAHSGLVVFGIGRDEILPKLLHIRLSNGEMLHRKIMITSRRFNIENINGVPQETVTPSPEIAARIEREQAEVTTARLRNDNRSDFDTAFIWPIEGRVSGVYGSQRIYNGTPKSWHSGLDVAAAQGTPIKAPAAGIISFAKPDLYLTGGTILIDHGMGISSNFLHLSRLDVKVGDRVEQGQTIGLVGATGRATGPHMHWGMNWLKVRIDPQLLLPNKTK
jgi:murein DD-endopeptidase MepM/ murein hydrolase activator NlpD